jgi:predicted nucleotidyltransferase
MALMSGISVPVERIDILVEFDPDATVGILKSAALSKDLEALFCRRIDLLTKLGLKPWVRPHVLSEAKLVYAS